MKLNFASTPVGDVEADWLIVTFCEQEELSDELGALDTRLGGMLARMKDRGDLKGSRASLIKILDAPGISADRILLVGVGEHVEVARAGYLNAMQEAAQKICSLKSSSVAMMLSGGLTDQLTLADQAELVATAIEVGGMSAGVSKSESDRFPVTELTLIGSDPVASDLVEAAERGSIIGQSVNTTRELVNRPPNEIYPASFADRVSELAAEIGLGCEILDEHLLKSERMGALLAVAQGSVNDPRVVILRHSGGASDQPPVALVGKGVTFDSGGLSLKPNDGMKDMKCDMAGAGTVVGVMSAAARLKLPVNIIGLVGLVENMPSGTSYKLGDVLTARNGITIEVHNTDAEGRLVLADILSYAVDLGAQKLVDLATLTGACMVALGPEVTGAFSNNDAWVQEVMQSARDVGEPVWEMPMYASFNEQLKSQVADVKNVGTRWGGAITAAKFLERFVNDTPWVHLDIAGPSFADSGRTGVDSGATGCMVRGLIELCRRQEMPAE